MSLLDNQARAIARAAHQFAIFETAAAMTMSEGGKAEARTQALCYLSELKDHLASYDAEKARLLAESEVAYPPHTVNRLHTDTDVALAIICAKTSAEPLPKN